MEVRYKVRAVNKDGLVVLEEVYQRRSRALDVVEAQVEKGRRVIVRRQVEAGKFIIVPANEWGRRDHNPYEYAPKPLSTIFIHTSVTTQLGAGATMRAEKEQMRAVDNIAFGRGFNGFSYSFGVFPSGRAYEGRGFRVVEAATEPYNYTSDSICTIGNTDVFKPTEAQIDAIVGVIKEGQRQGHYAQKLDIRPHRAVAAKACPGVKFTDAMIAAIETRVN
jgi:hypothetical protein